MNPKKPRTPCLVCGKEPQYSYYKYCSNACQHVYQSQTKVERWKAGELTGLETTGVVTAYVKNYLRSKYKNKCCICGWAEVNPKTNQVPLIADHIDGNWRNNIESNLRLLCPNCDSLSPTYAALNKGNGRKNRVISNRVKEARFLMKGAKNKAMRILPFEV
ncbi:HNH endonuclease [Candidatus Kaiserbacteria bacterium]|nr:HNH endonuclease [Candidatus Kaiserbacteria bacterium]